METVTKEHQYKSLGAWRHAVNVKATNRRKRKQARATRQTRGQRPRHARVGGHWTRTKRRMCSHSWRH